MNSMKKIFAALLLAGAGFGLFVACGPVENNGAQSCTLDGDCPVGQACEAQVCVDTCETNADCSDGGECEEGVNTSQLVCKGSGTNNGTNNGSNNGSNNGTIANNGIPTVYYIALVQDTSSGDDACANNDPGSDISGVVLENDTGDAVGFGIPVWDDILADGNNFPDSTVLDGSPPDVGADGCPSDFADDTVVALGCGGWVAVEFWDNAGQRVPIEDGQQIRVYEYGGVCSTGSTDDTYDIFVCTDTAAISEGQTGSCSLDIVFGASGETVGTVTY